MYSSKKHSYRLLVNRSSWMVWSRFTRQVDSRTYNDVLLVGFYDTFATLPNQRHWPRKTVAHTWFVRLCYLNNPRAPRKRHLCDDLSCDTSLQTRHTRQNIPLLAALGGVAGSIYIRLSMPQDCCIAIYADKSVAVNSTNVHMFGPIADLITSKWCCVR